MREVEIWKPLKHENILELWGASYNRPYFLVSPYMFNKNLLSFLRSETGEEASKIRLMHGIAEGMKFLHSRDVCHVSRASQVIRDETKLTSFRLHFVQGVSPFSAFQRARYATNAYIRAI